MADNDLVNSPDGTKLHNVVTKQIKNQSVTVGTSAVLIGGSNARNLLLFQNLSSGVMYFGDVNVTTANGIQFANDTINSLDCLGGIDIYFISDTAGQDIRFAELI